jgi:hypothetical protein
MKKLFFVTNMICFLVVMLTSCNQVNECNAEVNTPYESKITDEVVRNAAIVLSKRFTVTRSGDPNQDAFSGELNEEELEAIAPFIEDGKMMVEELYAQINSSHPLYELTEDEVTFLKSLEEEQYAAMSFMYYGVTKEKLTLEIDGYSVGSCLSAAIGFGGSIDNLFSFSGLFTAKTALQIAKFFGKRYLFGYVGLAISVYDFAVCMDYIRPI